ISNTLSILIYNENFEELIDVVGQSYKKYPENLGLLKMMDNGSKQAHKDNKKAIRWYEDYLKRKFNYSTLVDYANILQEQGDVKKSLEIKMDIPKDFPYDPSGYSRLADHFYGSKDYVKAEEYIRKAMGLAPYNEYYWAKLGDIKSERKQTQEAINAYNKSLQYEPNQYDVINKFSK